MRKTCIEEFNPVSKKKKNLGLTILICTVICCVFILVALFADSGIQNKTEPHKVEKRKAEIKDSPVVNFSEEALSLDNAITEKIEPELPKPTDSSLKQQMILKF